LDGGIKTTPLYAKGYNMKVKQTKSLEVQNKIFKLRDLNNIACLFYEEFEDAKKINLNPSISFEVYTDNGSVYESSDSDFFSNEPLFSTISIKKVKFILRSYDFYTRRLEVTLTPTSSDYFSDNNITIYGYDINWVNGINARIKDLLDSVQPQSEYKKLILRITHFLSAIVIGRFFIFFVLIIDTSKPDLSQMSSTTLAIRSVIQYSALTYNFFIYLLSLLIGFYPAIGVRSKMKNIFPNIEFQIGPEHKQLYKRKRAKLINIFILIIIPLLLAIIYDIVKNNL
jgi:hypothetical protein